MSRPVGCNQGDPKVFTTYSGGIMQLALADGVTATSSNVVITTMNQVQFCGNLTLPATLTYPGVVATLPESCRPDEAVQLGVVVQLDDQTYHMCRVQIGTDGVITVTTDFVIHDAPITPVTLFLDSVSYDLASIRYGSYTSS